MVDTCRWYSTHNKKNWQTERCDNEVRGGGPESTTDKTNNKNVTKKLKEKMYKIIGLCRTNDWRNDII